MNKVSYSENEKSELLKEHRCPNCKSWDVIFYNPNLLEDNKIQTEFECQECSLYLIITSNLDSISIYGSQFESLGDNI